MFDLDRFISEYVTKRKISMFIPDILTNSNKLWERIEGKSLLVIGGAGTIGSSFIKAILPYKPLSLTVVDINENALAELTRDLRSTKSISIPADYITYPMDYASSVFAKMFRAHQGFDIVGNFSALKHVRSEKDIYSVEALLRNNVLNLLKLLDLLSEYPPQDYFCVSTDKAANPVNIMGASKRIMEDAIFSYSDRFPVKTARFANVAFSNGSLPMSFVDRMNRLQPISAPYDVRRYFVSPEESGQICLLSCILGNNREIFFPKLEEAQMMTFDVIATELLKSNGYEIVECISDEEALNMSDALKKGSNYYPVRFTASNTSGEKVFEEFVTDKETLDLHRFDSLGVIVDKEIPDKARFNNLVEMLECEFKRVNSSKEYVIKILREYLPDFEHIETGICLDSRM